MPGEPAVSRCGAGVSRMVSERREKGLLGGGGRTRGVVCPRAHLPTPLCSGTVPAVPSHRHTTTVVSPRCSTGRACALRRASACVSRPRPSRRIRTCVCFVLSADTEDVCIVERLFSSSLVAIVSLKAPRKLKVCHFKKGTEICNYSYSNTILAVKLNRQVSDTAPRPPGAPSPPRRSRAASSRPCRHPVSPGAWESWRSRAPAPGPGPAHPGPPPRCSSVASTVLLQAHCPRARSWAPPG